jgi:hypothetical protein
MATAIPAVTLRREGRKSRLATGAESFLTRAEDIDGERLACFGRLLQPLPSLLRITVGGQVRQTSCPQGNGAGSSTRTEEPFGCAIGQQPAN